MIGSKGGTHPLSPADTKLADVDRFVTIGSEVDAWAGREPRQGNAGVRIDSYPPLADRPTAYFSIRIGVRGGGPGELWYVYLYQRGDVPINDKGTRACGRLLGSGIYNKWVQTGGEKGFLGCPTTDEAEAGRSPNGTSGRFALFGAGDGGLIVWHRDGRFAGRSFEVHGCIFRLYQSLGGTGSWLGFPTSDEYDVPGGRRSDFENGYIVWNAQTRNCEAHKSGDADLSVEFNVNRPGGDYRSFDLAQPGHEPCRDACAREQMCRAYSYVRPGLQGPNARCWLKSSIPNPVANACCISGAKR
jgi:hypothetical protein